MSKRSKGRYLEKRVAEILTRAGWAVYLVQPSFAYNAFTKRYYARPQDIFGADIIAIKTDMPILFCQVTSDTNIKRKIEAFNHPFNLELTWKLIFLAKKKSGRWKFRICRVYREAIEWIDEDFAKTFGG